MHGVPLASWGTFVGVSSLDYGKLAARYSRTAAAYSATGSLSLSVASGRLAFTFGLRGPALSIDTACSSSLVAAHAALAALALGECGAAVAAGGNLCLSPETPAMFQRAGAFWALCGGRPGWGSILLGKRRGLRGTGG